MNRLTIPFTMLAVLALAACAATTPPRDDLDLRLQAATAAFGGNFDYLMVGSAGRLGDTLFVNFTRVTGASKMAQALAQRLAPGASRPVRILVTGADTAKTVQVILDALDLQGERRLPHLELLYLGEPAREDRVRRAVKSHGAHFRFAPYRG